MRLTTVHGTLLAAVALLTLGAADVSHAQERAREWQDRCRTSGRPTHCEVRESRVAATGSFHVNARPNGGVRVEAWDRNEVLVQARVQASAPSMAEAREIASQVSVEVGAGHAAAQGPRTRDQRSWSVSYDVFVPRGTNLNLESVNGGLRVTDVAGEVEASTTNGGIVLEGVRGTIRGSTTNGGITLRIADAARGPGSVDLRSTNGGITVELPRGYAANLQASTVNGGITTNLPVRAEGRRGRRLEAEIAGGGPPLRLRTTNGGIRIRGR